MKAVHDQQIQSEGRREYAAPRLVNYGSVTDLTASGSNGQAECQGNSKGSNGACRP